MCFLVSSNWWTMPSSWLDVAGVYRNLADSADPRTAPWPLVSSFWYPLTAAVPYVYFCWNAKSLTAKMPTYQIRPLLVAYNAVMVALSAYMTYEFFWTAYTARYSPVCTPATFSTAPLPQRMASVCWVYYVSKYVELAETVMFSLRKKYSQITFLHVYHHTSMLFMWWMFVKYSAGGHAYLFGGINSFVHTVMYTYYGLTAVGPHMQKYLWWKKYITVLQLVQFVILFFHCAHSVGTGCKFAPWLAKINFFYSVTLLALFLNFYYKSYVCRKQARGKKN